MKKFKLFLLLFLLSIYFLPSLVAAEDPGNPNPGNPPAGTVSLLNPINIPPEAKDAPIPYLLGTVINSVLGIIGSLALVMFIYGGATWMLSAGNQERVTKGKQILIWATIGIVIIFTAYALVKFLLTTVTGVPGA
jgi:type IV secretory pathway VirB2 component (pilin)